MIRNLTFSLLLASAGLLGPQTAWAEDSPQVSLGFIDDIRVVEGTPIEISASFTNIGGDTSIDSFDFEFTLDDEISSYHVDLPNTNPEISASVAGKICSFSFMIPAYEETGEHDALLAIKQLNGRTITINRGSARCDFRITVTNKGFPRKMVCEEYTGVWCSYCPKGWVAMEAMHRIFGDDFVGIAYHSNDVMTSDVAYPETVLSVPYLRLNRSELVSVTNVEAKIRTALAEDARAKIEVEAEWATPEGVGINVSSVVSTLDDVENNYYRIAYAVLHDNMSGVGSNWYQNDIGERLEPNYPEWNYLGGYLWYNDVVFEGTDMTGIRDCVPAMAGGEESSHSYFFDMTQHQRPEVQNKRDLRVVALLVDKNNVIVNADQTTITADPSWPLDGEFSGVEDVVDDVASEAVTARYYDLNGRSVAEPLAPGVYVRQRGTVVDKVVVR